jgi:hypothetical protein
MLIDHRAEPGSLVIDFQAITPNGLSSLRYLCESEATKNADAMTARMYWEAARAIHQLQQER